MDKKPRTFEELLDLWETPKALSADLGVPYVNAQAMKRRKSVGADHWPKMVDLAAKRGVKLTTDDMLAMRVNRRVAA